MIERTARRARAASTRRSAIPSPGRTRDYYDLRRVEAEMERQFDVCHGCRRCFNLCDSFPRLFDLIDEGPTGEVDGVAKDDYAKVDEACTLCDMCFMTKCPYVPPHPWDIDFPHLMLRHRAVKARKDGSDFVEASSARPTATASSAPSPRASPTGRARAQQARGPPREWAGIHHAARLPKYAARPRDRAAREGAAANQAAPPSASARSRSTPPASSTSTTPARRRRRARCWPCRACEATLVYPECCGMPQLEAGDLDGVAAAARQVAAALLPWSTRATTWSR